MFHFNWILNLLSPPVFLPLLVSFFPTFICILIQDRFQNIVGKVFFGSFVASTIFDGKLDQFGFFLSHHHGKLLVFTGKIVAISNFENQGLQASDKGPPIFPGACAPAFHSV